MEYWLAPNMGSPDMLELFSHPERWTRSREMIQAVKLYVQVLNADNPDDKLRAQCGPNVCPAIYDAGALAKLREMGKKLVIEAGAVKPGDCAAEGNTRGILAAIERVRAVGGEVDCISVDESLTAGSRECQQSIEDTARHTAKFIRAVRAVGANAGVIEAYPANPADHIEAYVRLLGDHEARPAFLHVDVDRLEFHGKKGAVPEKRFREDLARLQSTCRELGIKFGLLLWGNNAQSDAAFAKDALVLDDIFRSLAPADIDHLVVQSWQDRVPAGGLPVFDIPRTLPESAADSLTGLLLQIDQRRQQKPTPKNVFVKLIDKAVNDAAKRPKGK